MWTDSVSYIHLILFDIFNWYQRYDVGLIIHIKIESKKILDLQPKKIILIVLKFNIQNPGNNFFIKSILVFIDKDGNEQIKIK